MEKEVLIEHKKELSSMFDDYYFADEKVRKGKNESIRQTGRSQRDMVIQRFKTYVTSNPDIYEYIFGDGTPFAQHIQYDEMVQRDNFLNDMRTLFDRIGNDLK